MSWYSELPPDKKAEVKERNRTRANAAYRNLTPAQKEAKLEQYRRNSKARYERMKAQGVIKLKGRYKGKKGQNDKQRYVDTVKVQKGSCVDCALPCEEWNVVMFAFDHLDPLQKSFPLSKAKNHTFEEIDAEIAKCELVCHNCHAFRTWIERHHDNIAQDTTDALNCRPTFFDLIDN
jgi:hypothetical protein